MWLCWMLMRRQAFGGFAAALPEYKAAMRGLDKAHSLTLDGTRILPWLPSPHFSGRLSPAVLSSLQSGYSSRDSGFQADPVAGHKWLNVPYDCGLFFTRRVEYLTNIFKPPSADAPAYLAPTANNEAGADLEEVVPGPLFVGIENSRRFRALPLFASLMSLGRGGYEGVSADPLHVHVPKEDYHC